MKQKGKLGFLLGICMGGLAGLSTIPIWVTLIFAVLAMVIISAMDSYEGDK